MAQVGGNEKRGNLLFVGCAEKGCAVLQHSPSCSEQADGKTADEESRKSIQAQEIRDNNSR